MGPDEITVGPAGSGAMIAGETGEHIQYALDTLAQRGGGVVRVRPGEYHLADSIYLKSGVDLLGTSETVFRREGEVRGRGKERLDRGCRIRPDEAYGAPQRERRHTLPGGGARSAHPPGYGRTGDYR